MAVATWGTGSAEAGTAVSCVPLSAVVDVGVEGGCSTRRRGRLVREEECWAKKAVGGAADGAHQAG
jgi:hypothetical protein